MRRKWLTPALCVVLCLCPVWAQAQEQDGDARARAAASLYELASKDFAEGRFQEALDKLQEVYKLDPNPVILYNIGRSYEELGDLASAAQFFQQAVSDPTLPQELQAEIGKRLPRVLPALQLREARAVSSNMLRVGLKQAEDDAVAAFVKKQEDKKVVVQPPPVIKDQGPDPVLLWSGVGASVVGAGLLVGGMVVDLGLSTPISELKEPETRSDAVRVKQLQDEIDSGQTTAGLLYLSGGVVLVTGGVLVTLALLDGEEAPAAEQGSVSVSPLLGTQGAGLSLQGSFP